MVQGQGVIGEGTQCRCCGAWVKLGYVMCIPCVRKREKIRSDCLGAGLSLADAERVVERGYPRLKG